MLLICHFTVNVFELFPEKLQENFQKLLLIACFQKYSENIFRKLILKTILLLNLKKALVNIVKRLVHRDFAIKIAARVKYPCSISHNKQKDWHVKTKYNRIVLTQKASYSKLKTLNHNPSHNILALFNNLAEVRIATSKTILGI